VKYLVDANVLSEPTKSEPQTSVVLWLNENEKEICVNPIVLGEMKYGILMLPEGKRRRALLDWFHKGVIRIPLLKLDSNTAHCWAQLLSDLRSKGNAMPVKDSLIAASASQHNLTVVTRNVKDFRSTGLRVLDPFTPPRDPR